MAAGIYTLDTNSCVEAAINALSPEPSLALIPSAYKVGSTASVLPTNGTGDFTHTRSTTATRINSSGAIETMAINVPRIDHTDGGCPILLLEPQSTNLYINSDVLVTQNVTTTANDYTVSFYGTGSITFSGTHSGTLTGTGVSDRVSITFTATAGTLISNVSGSVLNSQAEALSYPTSYIPTDGTTVTRTADVCGGAGDVSTFNSVEGVLYAEIAASVNDLSFRNIAVSNGTSGNAIKLYYTSTSNSITMQVRFNTSLEVLITASVSDITSLNKIAVKWKVNNFTMWINGVEVAASLSGDVPIGLNVLSLDDGGGGSDFYGKVKQIQVFKTVLTDAELITLTTP
tara:strand:- start:643 stop:1674 length:1032 start_codon:yes stop_codon:yes gene_type:complete